MPIPEGEASREILLPNNDLVVGVGGETHRFATKYDLQPWVAEPDQSFDVPGLPYRLRVDRYFATATVVDTLVEDVHFSVNSPADALGYKWR